MKRFCRSVLKVILTIIAVHVVLISWQAGRIFWLAGKASYDQRPFERINGKASLKILSHIQNNLNKTNTTG